MNADFQFESDGSELGLYSQGDIYFVTSQERLVKKSHLRENIGPVASQEQYYYTVSAMLKGIQWLKMKNFGQISH